MQPFVNCQCFTKGSKVLAIFFVIKKNAIEAEENIEFHLSFFAAAALRLIRQTQAKKLRRKREKKN